MDANDKILTLFTTRMRQMILLYKEKVRENKNLMSDLEKKDQKIIHLQGQLTQVQRDYDSLKMAKMIEVTDNDLEKTKGQVSKIIRDINKCITLLNEK